MRRGGRREGRIASRGSNKSRLLLLLLALGLKLVLQVLHIVVCVVLQRGLGRLTFLGGLLRRRLLAGRAEDCRHDHEQRRAKIDKGLEVLLQHALGLIGRMPQLRLKLRPSVRIWLRSKNVLGHDSYPFRVKSMRFLPSST